MTAYAGVNAVNETLTASTVDTVILSKPSRGVTVVNVSGSAIIYFTVSHPGGSNPQPTIGGANCYVLPATVGSLDVTHDGQFGSVVNLISSGTPAYSVSIPS